jgi:hypothetical protein
VSKKFGEWYQKTNKTGYTNKLTLLAFKIIAILHNTLLATFIKLMETVSKGLFRNRSQNRCHAFMDCRHICKTCAFHDALQARKQKEVHPPYSPDLAPAILSYFSIRSVGQNCLNFEIINPENEICSSTLPCAPVLSQKADSPVNTEIKESLPKSVYQVHKQ